MHHNRLSVGIGLVNLALLVYGATAGGWFSTNGIALGTIANASIVNLTIGILFRQQYLINAIFLSATSAPTSWPLRIRWTLGKVYHVFGGGHIGGVVSGSVWFAVLLGAIGYHQFAGLAGVSALLVVLSAAILALLAMMIVFALPRNRAADHDRFERSHRFGGWASLVLFWLHLVALVDAGRGSVPTRSLWAELAGTLGFWMLAVVTISIALPWLRLKKVSVDITTPSDHVALTRFDYGETPFAGSSSTISRNPLMEWHAFANVPSPDASGFRLTISRAGDWTGQLIDDKPDHVWVKGITTAGVGNVDRLFERVVWVATGSGIGPTLPHLLAQEVPAHLVWATRNPRKTYGDELVDEILEVQPNATIWDTDANGKPDMVKLAYQAVEAFDAEAVICISNKKLTWQVVEGLEKVGIPAFGAIFDS